MFMPIIFDCRIPYQTIHSKFSGGIARDADYQMQLIKYGPSAIDVPVKSIPELLIQEILNPFYLF